MKNFVVILLVIALMMSTVAFANESTDMQPRLEGVKGGMIVAEQQGYDGVWYYVVVYPEDDNRLEIMDSYLEVYLVLEDDGVIDPGQKPFKEINFQNALNAFLEDDWESLMVELLGDSWTDDELIFGDEWFDDEEWQDEWENQFDGGFEL